MIHGRDEKTTQRRKDASNYENYPQQDPDINNELYFVL